MNSASRFVRFAAIALFASLAPGVRAQTVATPYAWFTLLDNSSPFFDRRGGGIEVFYYSAVTFIPDTSGNYTLETTAALFQPSNWSDTYIHLYQGGFDPLNPLVNLIAQDDDGSIDKPFVDDDHAERRFELYLCRHDIHPWRHGLRHLANLRARRFKHHACRRFAGSGAR